MSRGICCLGSTGLCMGVECELHGRLRASCGSDLSRKLISRRPFRWRAIPWTKCRISMPPALRQDTLLTTIVAYYWPGARSEGLPSARQLEAPGVGAPCAPLSFTKSVPKYEKPGVVPPSSTQWTAEAGPTTMREDIAANAMPTAILFFNCRSPPFILNKGLRSGDLDRITG